MADLAYLADVLLVSLAVPTLIWLWPLEVGNGHDC